MPDRHVLADGELALLQVVRHVAELRDRPAPVMAFIGE
jgi:hypothetical protein